MINFMKVITFLSKIKHQIRIILHKGNTYNCPFCNYSSKDLALMGFDLPVIKEKKIVGGGLRHGACHNCDSSDRERLIYVYLKETLKFFATGKNKSILHVAPEKNLSKKIFEFGFDNYVCGDLFTEGYSYPSHVLNMSILDIPYPENTFDLVICNHVLEHVKDDDFAMKEILRVLKTGGQAILQVPISSILPETFEDYKITDPKQREIVFGQFNHIRIYGQDYTKRLEKSGFSVNQINISSEYVKYGLNINEDLFICKKL